MVAKQKETMLLHTLIETSLEVFKLEYFEPFTSERTMGFPMKSVLKTV